MPLWLLPLVKSKWLWIALACAALLTLGKCAHDREVHRLVEHTRETRDAEWKGAFDKMRAAAQQWRQNYEAKSQVLADELRAAHRHDLDDNRRSADALLLRGPGKAAAGCGPIGNPGLSTAPGGHGGGAADPDAPVAPVPPDEPMAIVPWNDLVRRAREHDDLLSEVTTWRSWHSREKALHDAAVAVAELPEVGFGGEAR